MGKYTGVAIASLTAGVILPLLLTTIIVSKIVEKKPTVEETQEVIQVEPSVVETFIVDYEQFGNMRIGEEFIRGNITNSTTNTRDCTIYLESLNGVPISERIDLKVSQSASIIKTTWTEDTKGKYDMKLIYEIEVDDSISKIECPYTILLNGGN